MRPQRFWLVIPIVLFLGLVWGLGNSALYGAEMAHNALPSGTVPLPAGVPADWWAAVQQDMVQSPNPRGLSPTPDWTAESNQEDAEFGYSVGTAGDVNGDGYDDVIVGAYHYSNDQSYEGRAFVYYGSASGLSTTANWTAESDQAGAQFGVSVGTAGDVNGDSYDDVIVGAWSYNNGQDVEGRAFVYHGSSTGLSTIPDWTAEGDQTYAYFGVSVGTAGDVNGDGYDDVIVGAWDYDNGQSEEGRAFVYHGSAAGLSTTANWTAESDQDFANFGVSVDAAGDVNGDGFSDVIVGAYTYTNGQSQEGRAYVYHGSAGGLSATPNWTAESNQAGASFGYSVGTAGDVNDDGYSDVVVGAYGYDNGQDAEGRAFVYHGSPGSLSTDPNWVAESNQAVANFGWSVGTAGDVNSDGFSDVIVTAYTYDNGQSNEGRAFAFHGSSSGLSPAPSWAAESDQELAYFGVSAGTAGDVNDDGFSDVIVGAYYYDNGQDKEGRAFVYHGLVVFIPISGLEASNNGPTELGQSTTLTVTIAAGNNVTYEWDFGDGSPSMSGAVVTHVYAAAGVYTATVTATNPVSTASAQTTVAVIAPEEQYFIYLPLLKRP